MSRVVGLIFSARTGGNLFDMATHLFSTLAVLVPEADCQLIETATCQIQPCNGCAYECLLGRPPHCPIADDVTELWQGALRSDLLVYFIPTYGGMPPATWVAFQQRYHGVACQCPEPNPAGKIAVLSLYDPLGTRSGDVSQQCIQKHLAAQPRPLVSMEQLTAANYGLNALGDRLIAHGPIQDRLTQMAGRLAAALW